MQAPDDPWDYPQRGRTVRERAAREPAPAVLSADLLAHRELLQRWVAGDALERSHATLMKLAGGRLEDGDALCEALVREGWAAVRERFERGSWHWKTLQWRELPRLQVLLGVTGPARRAQERLGLLEEARAWWLQAQEEGADPELLAGIGQALDALAQERLRGDVLAGRVGLLQALVRWQQEGREGHRRDFALQARGATKDITAAEWQWLQERFDLERLRISPFAFTLALAGQASLQQGASRLDLGLARFLMLPLADVLRIAVIGHGPTRWWLVENRASFERQAGNLERGELLVWLPGRPSAAWLQSMAHLLRLAPAPARISADADPAGVDIACTAGALWEAQGLAWEPFRMGVAELEGTRQQWSLNAHDTALLERLLQRPHLPPALRALCEAMRRSGRKAEQESWL